jgi:hypothetical protein
VSCISGVTRVKFCSSVGIWVTPISLCNWALQLPRCEVHPLFPYGSYVLLIYIHLDLSTGVYLVVGAGVAFTCVCTGCALDGFTILGVGCCVGYVFSGCVTIFVGLFYGGGGGGGGFGTVGAFGFSAVGETRAAYSTTALSSTSFSLSSLSRDSSSSFGVSVIVSCFSVSPFLTSFPFAVRTVSACFTSYGIILVYGWPRNLANACILVVGVFSGFFFPMGGSFTCVPCSLVSLIEFFAFSSSLFFAST